MYAFDTAADAPVRGPTIRDRAEATGTTLVGSPSELAGACDIIFSAVTADQAVHAARSAAPHLKPRHLFADLNSVSPRTKCAIGEAVTGSGAAFLEVAVMAAVAPYLHRVPMIVGGAAAPRLAELLSPFDMRLELMPDAQIGAVAAVKMCRSVVVKGLEALLCECILAASRYGAQERVFRSLEETFPGVAWESLTSSSLNRMIVHGERRAREMEEAAQTLRDAGVDPLMAEATARRQQWAGTLGGRDRFGPNGPRHYADVLNAIAEVS